MEFKFREDCSMDMIAGRSSIRIHEVSARALMGECVKQYAKLAVIDRLNALKDTDKEYPCFEGMSVPAILADTALVDNIAAGLVGAWDLDLAEDEHVDNEIAFWIKENAGGRR